jgi:hypothetical protein
LPGPAPKSSATRARTNSETQSTVLVADPDREVPTLPAIRNWQDTTRDFWTTLWKSGMAQMYQAADTPGLIRLATLTDDFFLAETPEERRALSSEIRQLEKTYGLNPEARVKLRWLVYEAESARKRVEDDRPQPPISADRSLLFQ